MTALLDVNVLRISSNRKARQISTTPSIAIAQLAALTGLRGHTFWPDDVSLVVGDDGDPGTVTGHRQVTDRHLITLADRYGGRLITFDVALRNSAPEGIIEVIDS